MEIKALCIGIITTSILSSSVALAGMYKWVDSEGNVQYSQEPPPDRPVTTINLSPSQVGTPSSTEQASEDKSPKDDAPNAQKSEKAQERAKKNEEIRAKNCETGRHNLDVYKTQRRVTVNGEVKALDDNERNKAIEEAQKIIDKNCQ